MDITDKESDIQSKEADTQSKEADTQSKEADTQSEEADTQSEDADTQSEEADTQFEDLIEVTIRPPFAEKFNSVKVKEILRSVIHKELDGKKYLSFSPEAMMDHLGKIILKKLQDLPYESYKYCVNLVIAEQKGQGLRNSSSCLWDSDTDDVASEFIITEHLICIATVFGVYHMKKRVIGKIPL